MARIVKKIPSRLRKLFLVTALRNWTIIELLSDGKPRRPMDMARDLKGVYKQASLFKGAKELTKEGILVPQHMQAKDGTYLLGMTLHPKMKELLARLDKWEKDAGEIRNPFASAKK